VSELGDAFAQLLGRQPTDKERPNLYRVRDALNLRTTDSLCLVLMVLERYETLYEKVSARIMDTVRAATKAARETAEAQAKVAQEETKNALMEAVRPAVVSAKQAAGAQAVKCVSILATAMVAFVVKVGVLAFRKGEASVHARVSVGAGSSCVADDQRTWRALAATPSTAVRSGRDPTPPTGHPPTIALPVPLDDLGCAAHHHPTVRRTEGWRV